MLFNSYIFMLAFLPIVIIVYFTLNSHRKYKSGILFLLAASLIFYGYNYWGYLLLLSGSIVFNFFITRSFTKANGKAKTLLMVFAITMNVLVLFYFKYFNFFVDNVNSIFGMDWNVRKILLPLGISFFTFQQISYVVDCYRDDTIKYDFGSYAAYVAFFPQLVAGPIVTHEELIPQFHDEKLKKPDFANLSAGTYSFAMGLAKKVLIADNLSKIVTVGYADVSNLSAISAVIVMLSYTFQIYFDFSGYSDMALGLARMLNFRIPTNFNSPYKAASIGEFWERWHMTLTRFLTRYIYIPLGGSRKGLVRTCVNTMLVFMISGLWHGANWTFVLWGTLHGCFKVLERLSQKWFDRIPKVIRWVYAFGVINILWVYFRADSVASANQLIVRIIGLYPGGVSSQILEAVFTPVELRILYHFLPLGGDAVFSLCALVAILVILLIIVLCCKNVQAITEHFKRSKWQLAVTVIMLYWCIMSLSDVSEFLYFNF